MRRECGRRSFGHSPPANLPLLTSQESLITSDRGAPHAGHGRGREAEPWSDWERAARAIQTARRARRVSAE
jgi:hypothetical protein